MMRKTLPPKVRRSKARVRFQNVRLTNEEFSALWILKRELKFDSKTAMIHHVVTSFIEKHKDKIAEVKSRKSSSARSKGPSVSQPASQLGA